MSMIQAKTLFKMFLCSLLYGGTTFGLSLSPFSVYAAAPTQQLHVSILQPNVPMQQSSVSQHIFLAQMPTSVQGLPLVQVPLLAQGPPNFNRLPTKQDLDSLNPFLTENVDPALAKELSTPGGILSRVLVFIFPAAGLALFVLLTYSGAEIILGATDDKLMQQGKKRAEAALKGFFLLFSTYWVAQIIQAVFGLKFL